jgi:ELWxxDGT repeat protein
VAVNDAPHIHIPKEMKSAISAEEDVVKALHGIFISDVDVDTVTMVIRVSSGTIIFGNATTRSLMSIAPTEDLDSGSSMLTINASITDINAALESGLHYASAPNWNTREFGFDSIEISVFDNGFTGSGGAKMVKVTMSVDVDGVNDAPVINTPSGVIQVQEDEDHIFIDLDIVDPDANFINPMLPTSSQGMLEVNITTNHGIVSLATLAGLHILSGTGTAHTYSSGILQFRGRPDLIKKAIRGLTYRGSSDWSGDDEMQISVSDLGNSGKGGILTASSSITILVTAVNDAPSLIMPSQKHIEVEEDTWVDILGVQLIDQDAGKKSLIVELAVVYGSLEINLNPGVECDDKIDSKRTFALRCAGHLDSLNKAIAQIKYRGKANFVGLDMLDITVDDQIAQKTTSHQLIRVIPVNDAPTISLKFDSISAEEDEAINFATLSEVVLDDVDVDDASFCPNGKGNLLKMILSTAHGSLFFSSPPAGIYFSGSHSLESVNKSMVFEGGLANVKNAMKYIKYVGSTGWSGKDTVGIQLDDMGNCGGGGALTSDLMNIHVNVLATNDAPVVSAPGGGMKGHIRAFEDVPTSFSPAFTVTDTDSVGGAYNVTISSRHGGLALNFSGLKLAQLQKSVDLQAPATWNEITDGSYTAKLISFRTTISTVNTLLKNLIYKSNANFNAIWSRDPLATHSVKGMRPRPRGEVSLERVDVVVTDDGGVSSAPHMEGGELSPYVYQTASAFCRISVDAVNDAPVVLSPMKVEVLEDTPTLIPDIIVSDIDANETVGGEVTVTVSAQKGYVSIDTMEAHKNGVRILSGKIPAPTVSAAIEYEIQEVSVSAQAIAEQHVVHVTRSDLKALGPLDGSFAISTGNIKVSGLAFATSAEELKTSINSAFAFANKTARVARVTLSSNTTAKSNTWTIVYTVESGNVAGIEVAYNALHESITTSAPGSGATIICATVVEGNLVGGSFSLALHTSSNVSSQMLPFDVSASDLENALLSLNVSHTDSRSNWNISATRSGPHPLRGFGFSWTITFFSNYGDLPLLKVNSSLTGNGSQIEVKQINAGIATYSGDRTRSLRIAGATNMLNNVLKTLKYTSALNQYSTTDVLNIVATDGGFSGLGSALQGSSQVHVYINATNDIPIVIAPSATEYTVAEDSELLIEGIAVKDADAANRLIEVSAATFGKSLITLNTYDNIELLSREKSANERQTVHLYRSDDSTQYIYEQQTITTSATLQAHVQRVKVVATSGSFTLSLEGQVSSDIPVNTNDAGMKAQMDKLSAVLAGINVETVTSGVNSGTQGKYWDITFTMESGSVEKIAFADTSKLVNAAGSLATSVTSAQAANLLSGFFTLSYDGFKTPTISFDASASDLKSKLEVLPSIGKVTVTRSVIATSQKGYTWTVTFNGHQIDAKVRPSNVGDTDLLVADANWLNGVGKAIAINEVVKGSAPVWGSFSLGLFQGNDMLGETFQLSHDANEITLRTAITKVVPSSFGSVTEITRAPSVIGQGFSWSIFFKEPAPQIKILGSSGGNLRCPGAHSSFCQSAVLRVAIGSPKLTFRGLLSDVNTALSKLILTGTNNWNSNTHGSEYLLVAVSDGESTKYGSTEKMVSPEHKDYLRASFDASVGLVQCFVSAVNDAPVVVVSKQLLNAAEDTQISVPGVAVSDADVDETYSGVLEVHVSADHGRVSSLSHSTLEDNEGTGLIVRGSTKHVNTALKKLLFKPSLNWNSALNNKVDEIQRVSLKATGPRNIQVISTEAQIGTISGTFVLSLNLTSFSGTSCTSAPIAFNAVASVSDEDSSGLSGKGSGESVEAKLLAMSCVSAANLVVRVRRSCAKALDGIQCSDDQGGYKWEVSFFGVTVKQKSSNAPISDSLHVLGVPLMTVASNNLGTAMSVKEVQIITTSGTGTLGGTFTVKYGLDSTGALNAASLTAGELKSALEGLTPITSVSVSRGNQINNGWPYYITFISNVGDLPLLTTDVSQMTEGGRSQSGTPATREVQTVTLSGNGALGGTFTVTSPNGVETTSSLNAGPSVETSEVQVVTTSGAGPLGGTFTLSFGGETSSGLNAAYATAGEVQSALEGFSGIGSAGVIVTRSSVPQNNGYSWSVTFKSRSGNVPSLIASNANMYQISGGLRGALGTGTVAVREETEGSGAATAFELKSALETLSSVGIVNVDRSSALNNGFTYSITFMQDDGDIDPLTVSDAAIIDGGDAKGVGSWNAIPAINEDTKGVAEIKPSDAQAQVFEHKKGVHVPSKISLALIGKGDNNIGGTFKLKFEGEATSDISVDASAEDVKTALQTLSTVGSVSVERLARNAEMGYTWDITFTHHWLPFNLGDMPMLEGIASSLTGENAVITIDEKTKGSYVPALITVSANDQGNYPGPSKSHNQIIEVLVTPAPDAPIFALPTGAAGSTLANMLRTSEDTAFHFSSQQQRHIQLSDPDSMSSSEAYEVSIVAGRGALSISDSANILSALTISETDMYADYCHHVLSFECETVITTTGVQIQAKGKAMPGLTFSGSLAAINAALDTLKYVPNQNWNGRDIIYMTAKSLRQLSALVAQAQVVVHTDAVNDPPKIVVPPTVTTNEDLHIVIGGVAVDDPDVKDLSYASREHQKLLVQITCKYGYISFDSRARYRFRYLTGKGDHDKNIVLEGGLNDINLALGSFSYIGDMDWSGEDSISITVWDQGNGNDVSVSPKSSDFVNLTDSASVLVVIKTVNDAPVFHLPDGPHSVSEDSTLAIAGVRVSDVDLADSAVMEVTISSAHGVISLASVTGLEFNMMGTGTSDKIAAFRGKLSDVNRALGNLTYLNDLDWNGYDTITMTARNGEGTDGGVTSSTTTIWVRVNAINDSPTITVVGGSDKLYQGYEGETTYIDGITVNDVDYDEDLDGALTLSLSVKNGMLSVDSEGVSKIHYPVGDILNGDKAISLTGSVNNLNAALLGLRYIPDKQFNGKDILRILVDDNGNTGSQTAEATPLKASHDISINVESVNDAPTISGPISLILEEDVEYYFTDINIGDADLSGTAIIEVELKAIYGTLSVGSDTSKLKFKSGQGKREKFMSFSGTLVDINAALAGLSYLSSVNYFGHDTLTVNTKDASGFNGIVSKTIALYIEAVNDAPTVTLDPSMMINAQKPPEENIASYTPVLSIAEEGVLPLLGINVSDVDLIDGSSGTVEVRVYSYSGKPCIKYNKMHPGVWCVNCTGPTDRVYHTLVLRGKPEHITSAFNNGKISYAAVSEFSGTERVFITAKDSLSISDGEPKYNGLTSQRKNILIRISAINDAPTIAIPADIGTDVNEDQELVINGIDIYDKDIADNKVLHVTLKVKSGTISLNSELDVLSNLEFLQGDGTRDTEVVFNGLPTHVASACKVLTYLGAANFNGLDDITITVSDGESGDHKSTTESISVRVRAINDPPTITAPPLHVEVDEDKTILVSGIIIADVDIHEIDESSITVTLTVSNGIVTTTTAAGLNIIEGDSLVGSSNISFYGSISNVNQGLATLHYKPKEDWFGSDTLTITVNDGGNSGSGGSLSASRKIKINVAAINDAPVLVINADGYTTQEDTVLSFTGIAIKDIDAAADEVITVTARSESGNGFLSLSNIPGGLTGIKFLSSSNGLNNRPGVHDSHFVLQGILSDIQAAFRNLSYVGATDYFGEDELYLSVSDGGGDHASAAAAASPETAVSRSIIFVRGVNDAPVIHVKDSGKAFNLDEDMESCIGADISIEDVDIDGAYDRKGTMKITVSANAGFVRVSSSVPGIYILPRGPSFEQRDPGLGGDGLTRQVVFKGTQEVVNAAIKTLHYVGIKDYVGTDTVTIIADDQGYSGYSPDVANGLSSKALSTISSIAIFIEAVNDAPQIHSPLSITAIENADTGMFDLKGMSISDVDAGQTNALTLTILCPHGTVTLNQAEGLEIEALYLTGDGISDSSIVVRGSLSTLNSLLHSVIYRGNFDFSGSSTINVTIFDEENTGKGGPLSTNKIIPIEVQSMNSAPIINGPKQNIVIEEDTQYSLQAFNISDSDVANAPNGYIELSLSASHGAAMEVQTVTTHGQHVNEVQIVSTTAAAEISGTFTLNMDLAKWGGSSATTGSISVEALGMANKEQTGAPTGRGEGESMESKIRSGLDPLFTGAVLGKVAIEVSRTKTSNLFNWYSWSITFLNAPHFLPQFQIASDNTAGLSSKVEASTLIDGNSLAGTFKLGFQGHSTRMLYHDTSALALQAELESLTTIGAVSITRTGPDLNDGFSWTITFFSPSGDIPALTGDATGLTTTCKRKTTQGDLCVFPFHYAGVEYSDCSQTGFQVQRRSEVQSIVTSGSGVLGGTFSVSFRGQTSKDLIVQSLSAVELQNALHNLSTVNHVTVSRLATKNASKQERNGWTYLITFVGSAASDAGDVPMLVTNTDKMMEGGRVGVHHGDSNALVSEIVKGVDYSMFSNEAWCATEVDHNGMLVPGKWGVCSSTDCDGKSLTITESITGGGLPELQRVTTQAKHVDEVQTIRTSAPSTITDGGFKLRLDMAHVGHCWTTPITAWALDRCPKQTPYVQASRMTGSDYTATSEVINHAAVAMKSDEGLTHDAGSNYGESMQSKIEALANIGGMTTVVTRGAADANGGYTWSVTFKNAIASLPQLEVVENTLVVPAGGTIYEEQTLQTKGSGNLGGTFTLSFRGQTTVPLDAVHASGTEVKSALEALSTIGTVEVTTFHSLGFHGMNYKVKFMTEFGDLPSMTVDMSSMTEGGRAPGDVEAVVIETTKGVKDGASITLATVTQGNQVGGSFKIRSVPVGNKGQTESTGLLSHSISALQLHKALLALPSIRSSIGVGSLAVGRSLPDSEGGYQWTIAFTEEHYEGHPRLIIDASGLTGIGSGGSSGVLQIGGSHGSFVVKRADALSFTSEGSTVGKASVILSFKGSVAAINFALQSAFYKPSPHWNGNVRIVVTANDHGFSGGGGAKSTTLAVPLTVNAVNDSPYVIAPKNFYNSTSPFNSGLRVEEDTDMAIKSIQIADPDSSEGLVFVSLTTDNGLVTVSRKSPLWPTDTVLHLTGTISQINADLRNLVYRTKPNYNGYDYMHIIIRDNGFSGSGGNKTSRTTFLVPVIAVNDAPEVTGPSSFIVPEDSVKMIPGVSFVDVDVNEFYNSFSLVQVKISAMHGNIGLYGLPEGLHVTEGIPVSGHVLSFTASAEHANEALRSLTYVSDKDFNGDDTVVILVNDMGNTGSHHNNTSSKKQGTSREHSVDIPVTVTPVNDAPEISIPLTPLTCNEDAQSVIVGLSISDVDILNTSVSAASEPQFDMLGVRITTSRGSMTLTRSIGLSFSEGDGELDETMSFNGTVADINRALSKSVFRPQLNWNSLRSGVASIQISVEDFGHGQNNMPSTVSKQTLIVIVEAVNDAPVIDVSGATYDPVYSYMDDLSKRITDVATLVVDEDSSVLMNGISVRDVDSNDAPNGHGLLQIQISASNGTVNIPSTAPVHKYIAGTSASSFVGGKTLMFLASVENANLALQGLRYKSDPNYHGSDAIVIIVDDMGNVGKRPEPIPDIGPNGTVIDVNVSRISRSKETLYSNMATLAGETVPGKSLMDKQIIPIFISSVNDAPTITIPSPQNAIEDEQLVISGIRIDDADMATAPNQGGYSDPGTPVFVSIAVQHGSITLTEMTGLSFLYGDGELDGFMEFNGTLADINRALSQCVYRNDKNFNTLFKEDDTITFSVDDLNNEGLQGSGRHHEISETLYVTVIPSNDRPTVHVPGAHKIYDYDGLMRTVSVDVLVVEEDTTLILSGVSIEDVDASESFDGVVATRIEAQYGTVSLSSIAGLHFTRGTGSNDHVVSFEGSLGMINAALFDMSYIGDKDWNGWDNVTITVDDQGNTGVDTTVDGHPYGISLSHSQTIPVQVKPVNDAPEWSGPTETLAVEEDSVLTIPRIKITDVDASGTGGTQAFLPGGNLSLTIRVKTGKVSLTRVTGLNFQVGDGVLNNHIICSGMLEDLNRALEDLDYIPADDWTTNVDWRVSGAHNNDRDVISLDVDDQGNVGSGGAHSASFEVFVQRVEGVNDAPVVKVPGATTVLQPCQEKIHGQRTVSEIPLHQQCGRIISVDTIMAVEDVPQTISGIEVEDVDVDEGFGGTITVTVFAHHGKISLSTIAGLNLLEGSQATCRSGCAPGQIGGDSRIVFKGALENVNAALNDLKYVGDVDWNGFDNLTIIANDNGNTGKGGPLHDSQTIPIDVAAVNDGPVWSGPFYIGISGTYGRKRRRLNQQPLEAVEDGEFLYIPGVAISDVDAENAQLEVSLSVQNGYVSLGDSSGLNFVKQVVKDGEEDGGSDLATSVTFTGSLLYINNALSGLKYLPKQNWNSAGSRGKDKIELIVDDRQSSGTGKSSKDSLAIHIWVSPTNDAPVLDMPGAHRNQWHVGTARDNTLWEGDMQSLKIISIDKQYADEDQRLFLDGISVRDVDFDGNEMTGALMQVSIAADVGTVSVTLFENSTSDLLHPSLTDLTGLFFSQGSGRNDRSMIFQAPLKRVMEAMARLSFMPSQDYAGEDRVTIVVNDLGNAGSGKSGVLTGLTDKQSIDITVRPLNDAPLLTLPRTKSGSLKVHRLDEEGLLRITGARYHGLHTSLTDTYTPTQTGFELWRSEGAEPLSDWPGWRGKIVKDVWKGSDSSNPAYFVVYKNDLYFRASDGNTGDGNRHGAELWRTHHSLPTASSKIAVDQGQALSGQNTAIAPESTTELVKDIMPGTAGSSPSYLTVSSMSGASLLYFSANGIDTTWILSSTNRSYIPRDGKAVYDDCNGLRASSKWGSDVIYAISKSNTWNKGDVYDCPIGYHWASTAEGLQRVVLDADADALQRKRANERFHAPPPKVYYGQCSWTGYSWNGVTRRKFRFADSHLTGSFLSAGSREDAELIMDDMSTSLFAGTICVKGEAMECLGADRTCYVRAGEELMVTDGTEQGTKRVADINPGLASSSPKYIVDGQWAQTSGANATLYFSATDGTSVHGRELWRSSGTPSSTVLVEDIHYGHVGSDPRYLTIVSGKVGVFFSADDGQWGRELWFSDGVTESSGSGSGTYMIKDIRAGSGGSEPMWITANDVDQTVFFSANDGINGHELWVSDGTKTGTTMVANLNPGIEGSHPSHLVMYNNKLYFSATDGTWGHELYVHTPGASTITRVKDICDGFCASNPRYLTVFSPSSTTSSFIYFEALSQSTVDGSQLWRTDGTESGTTRAFEHTASDLDLGASMAEAYPQRFAVYRDAMYYANNFGDGAVERPAGGIGGQADSFNIEDGGGVLQAMAITDVDIGIDGASMSSHMVSMELKVSKGKLSFAGGIDGIEFSLGSGYQDSRMRFNGTLAAINKAFRMLDYQASTDQNGEDAIAITVNDTAIDHTLAQGYQGYYHVVEGSIPLWINAVNDPPAIQAPASIQAYMEISNPLADISVSDVDASDTSHRGPSGKWIPAPVEVEIRAAKGRISLNSLKGLSFGGSRGAGDGIEDTVMRFQGSIENINKALFRARYVCSANRGCSPGPDVISIYINDNGFTGSGEAKSTRKKVQVKVI